MLAVTAQSQVRDKSQKSLSDKYKNDFKQTFDIYFHDDMLCMDDAVKINVSGANKFTTVLQS